MAINSLSCLVLSAKMHCEKPGASVAAIVVNDLKPALPMGVVREKNLESAPRIILTQIGPP